MFRWLIPVLILTGAITDSAAAQVLQFPGIGVSTVQSVVSVPDRGSAFLGGVSRGAMSQNQSGFAPVDSLIGQRHSNSSHRAYVTIHSFEEVDRILLSTPCRDAFVRTTFRNPRANSAWNQLVSDRPPAANGR